jgi:iron complex outermembrane receptor protein
MARTWQLSGEGTYRLHHRHSILGSAQGQWIQALATGYGRLRPEQARTLAQVSMRSGWQHERLVTLLTLRMEAITRPQWMPSAGITWQAHPALRLRGYVARTYRYPSFNDLYWSPGGQPDLKPETGWTAEAGWSYVCRPGNTILTLHQGVFSHHIQNWILWRPGTGYWSAENVLQVWSRGLESSLHWQRPAGRWVPACVVRHHLVRATRTAIYDGADATLHKQLIYTPVHQASVRVGISHRGYTLSYTQAYVGRRYTTADNTLFLSPFTLGSTALSRNFERRYIRGSLTLRAENLWQATYQVVAGYPMPRQQVHLDLSLSPVFAEAKP